jgi:hypothetical protein
MAGIANLSRTDIGEITADSFDDLWQYWDGVPEDTPSM